MKRFLLGVAALSLALGLTGCAPAVDAKQASASSTSANSWPTVDPSLIPPAATADLPRVNAADYSSGATEYIFKVGSGPTWCSINQQSSFVICEQDEAATQYDPIPVPNSCQYSFGFQIRLESQAAKNGKAAAFTCSGGYYADPSKAKTLEDGSAISVAGFTCYTAGQTARCDNAAHQYIVLGAKAWALGN
jgi:hypothetical protein